MWRRVLAKNRVSTRLPVASASPLAARLHTSPAVDTQAPHQERPSVFNVAKAAAHRVQTQHSVSEECYPLSAAAATNGTNGAAPSGTEPLSKKKLKKLKKKENHEAHVKHLEHQGQNPPAATDEGAERRRENHNTGADHHPQQHQQQHQHQHHASKKKKKKAPAVTESTSVVDAAQRTVPGAYGAFDGAITASQFHAQFAHVSGPPAPGRAADVKVGGRIVSVRAMGKLMFVTLRSDGVNLQVVLQVSDALSKDALHELRHTLRPGDVIGCAGSPGRTKAGELSLFAGTAPSVLAPYVCSDITTCPDQRSFSSGIVDEDLRHRYRFIDMISNPEANDRFRMRHRVLQSLREFFNSDGFVEVETPMFHSVPGGAAAKPFVTHHLANDCDLFLRIAPELYLKQCVVGGLERVYEVGRVFRNEDSDRSHNPEFTSCEFYQAYATYRDLVPKTEALVRHIALAATGSTTVRVVRTSGAVKECPSASSDKTTSASSTTGSSNAQDQKAQSGGPEIVEIDFSKPFRKVSVVPALQGALGVTFPPMAELDTPAGAALLTGLLMKHKIQLPSVRTPAKLFDKLIDHFITDDVVEPTFVMDHPVFMSPLAKAHPDGSGLSERFELFVNGMELCNAYSELNDPVEQHRRFEQQLRQRAMGDDESHSIDETFLKALQFGLPPTAGWGMGIDRLVMLLSGSQCIRDVIIFPLLKQDTNSHDTRRRRRTASFFNVDPHMTMFCLSSLEAELVRRGEQRGCTQLRSLRALLDEMAKEREAEGQPGRSPFAGACGLGAKGGKEGGLFGYYGTLHKGHEMMWSFIVNMMCRRPD